jgi:enterochelin esterase-like enzyme
MATATKGKRTLAVAVATDGKDITRLARIRSLITVYITARDIARAATVMQAERDQKEAGALLKDFMREHGVTTLTVGGLPVASLTTATRKVVDTERLAKQFPAAYAACVVEEVTERIKV